MFPLDPEEVQEDTHRGTGRVDPVSRHVGRTECTIGQTALEVRLQVARHGHRSERRAHVRIGESARATRDPPHWRRVVSPRTSRFPRSVPSPARIRAPAARHVPSGSDAARGTSRSTGGRPPDPGVRPLAWRPRGCASPERLGHCSRCREWGTAPPTARLPRRNAER